MATIGADAIHSSLSGTTVDVLTASAAVTLPEGKVALELAHYNEAATGTKKLSTGYVDQGGTKFTDLGVKGGDGADKNDGKTVGASNVLYGTLTVTVKLTSAFKAAAADSLHTGADGNKYTKTYILNQIKTQSVVVTVSIPDGSRARVFATDATAASGDPTTSLALSSIALTGIDGNDGVATATASCYIYVWGGSDVTDSVTDDGAGNDDLAAQNVNLSIAQSA